MHNAVVSACECTSKTSGVSTWLLSNGDHSPEKLKPVPCVIYILYISYVCIIYSCVEVSDGRE